MKYNIKVFPNSSKEQVVEGDPIKVYITASPEKGKANKAVIALLAKYFKVSKSNVNIEKGFISRNKVVKI